MAFEYHYEEHSGNNRNVQKIASENVQDDLNKIRCEIDGKEKKSFPNILSNAVSTAFEDSKVSKETKQKIFETVYERINHPSDCRRMLVAGVATKTVLAPIRILKGCLGFAASVISDVLDITD